jgi:hypothetical protein
MRFPTPGAVRRAGAVPVLLTALVASACSVSESEPTASPSALATTSAAPTATASATTSPTPTPTPSTTEQPPTRPPVETPPPPGAPTCKPAALTLTDADYTEEGGYRQELFGLRTSGPDCGLQGYPALELRDAAGRVIPVRWTKNGYGLPPAKPDPVTLSSTTSVSFSVSSPATGSCVEAAKVRATLAGVGTLTAATSVRICNGVAGISPVRRFEDDHTDG